MVTQLIRVMDRGVAAIEKSVRSHDSPALQYFQWALKRLCNLNTELMEISAITHDLSLIVMQVAMVKQLEQQRPHPASVLAQSPIEHFSVPARSLAQQLKQDLMWFPVRHGLVSAAEAERSMQETSSKSDAESVDAKPSAEYEEAESLAEFKAACIDLVQANRQRFQAWVRDVRVR
jgi:hypothetical protein